MLTAKRALSLAIHAHKLRAQRAKASVPNFLLSRASLPLRLTLGVSQPLLKPTHRACGLLLFVPHRSRLLRSPKSAQFCQAFSSATPLWSPAAPSIGVSNHRQGAQLPIHFTKRSGSASLQERPSSTSRQQFNAPCDGASQLVDRCALGSTQQLPSNYGEVFLRNNVP